MANSEIIPFSQVLENLLDADHPFQSKYMYRLSDLDPQEIQVLKQSWLQIPDWRRKALMEDAEEIGENDTLVSFLGLANLGLQDPEASVRQQAIRALWDYEEPSLAKSFLSLLVNDPHVEVRSQAASALGKFVYLGELEEIPESLLHQIEEQLLQVTRGDDHISVRRHALESLGYSSREDVTPLIEKAYHSGSKDWLTTALFAMGRSANEYWNKLILPMLDHKHTEIRTEAVRAAGELEMRAALPALLELLEHSDERLRLASIWAVSQIGGEGVREALQALYEDTEDEEELSLIEAAMDNLEFNDSTDLLPILDLEQDALDVEELDENLPEDEFDQEDQPD